MVLLMVSKTIRTPLVASGISKEAFASLLEPGSDLPPAKLVGRVFL